MAKIFNGWHTDGHRPVRREPATPGLPQTWVERVRQRGLSQFPVAVPALLAIAGAVVAMAMLTLDSVLGEEPVPSLLRFGEENARSLLAAVSGGLLTVVVLVFWVRMVAVQTSATLFSTRTVQTFLHDRFQQVTMGTVIGALSYMLVVMQAVPDGPAGMTSVPHLSMLAALLITAGVGVLVMESVSEGARSSETSSLLERICNDVLTQVRRIHPPAGEGVGPDSEPTSAAPPANPYHRVTAGQSGWVQRLDEDALLQALPAGTVAQLDVRVGLFLTEGTSLCRLWTSAENGDRAPEPGRDLPDDIDDRVRGAVAIGAGPTLDEDVGYGLRLLTDVAERALAPANGDTSVAEHAVMRLGVVLREVLLRDLPAPTREGEDGRVLLRPHELLPSEYVHKAFDRIRQSGAASPNVGLSLLSTLSMLRLELIDAGREPWVEPLCEQAELMLEAVQSDRTLSAVDTARLRDMALRQELVSET